MANDLTTTICLLQTEDSEYVRLVSLISGLWDKAKENAALAVYTELLDASWATGRYIVEFEQGGKAKTRYGEQFITNLAKDLTRMRGRGFSRSNLIYMRKFYLTFPKSETLSHQLTWSHFFELLKCDDALEMQSPFDAIKEVDDEGREWWNSRRLARPMWYQKYWNFERLMDKVELQLSTAIRISNSVGQLRRCRHYYV